MDKIKKIDCLFLVMKQFKFVEGPWTDFFKGQILGHQITIYKNPDNKMIVIIEDKEKDGALVEVYDFLYAEGLIDDFISTLPKTIIALTKHDKNRSVSFLAAPSLPTYADYVEIEDIVKEQLLKTKITKENILEVAKAYGLHLETLDNADEEIRQTFFTHPLIAPIISSTVQAEAEMSAFKAYNEIILGTNKKKQPIREPLSFFRKAVLTGSDFNGRLHFMHVFAESISLVKLPVIIFDFENYFEGLKEQTDKIKQLEESGIDLNPLSFPMQEYELNKDLKINISVLDAKTFLEKHGVRDEKIAHILNNIISHKPKNIEQFIEKAKSIDSKIVNENLKLKIIRILALINSYNKGLYGEGNDIDALTESKFKGMGTIHRIKVKKGDDENIFFLYALTEELKRFLKEQNRAGFIIIPKLHRFIGFPPFGELENKIVENIKEITDIGFGAILDEDNIIILPEEIKNFDTYLTVIHGRDASISFRSKRSYRIYIRPSLSKSILQE